MPDDTGADQESDEQSQQDQQSQDDSDAFDKDRALATIGKLRTFERLSKQQAKELEELRAAVKVADDAKLSEQERTVKALADSKAEVERLRQERTDMAIRLEVERQARQLNLVDEDTVYRLLDRADLADDATLTKEIERRLAALVKDKPFLVRAENGTGGHGVPATPKPAGTPTNDQVVQEKVEQLRKTGGYGRF